MMETYNYQYKPADIAKRITKLRLRKFDYKKDMARILGITPQQYGKIEKKGEGLTIKHLIDICFSFEVSADYILGLPTFKRMLPDEIFKIANNQKILNQKLAELDERINALFEHSKKNTEFVLKAHKDIKTVCDELNEYVKRLEDAVSEDDYK